MIMKCNNKLFVYIFFSFVYNAADGKRLQDIEPRFLKSKSIFGDIGSSIGNMINAGAKTLHNIIQTPEARLRHENEEKEKLIAIQAQEELKRREIMEKERLESKRKEIESLPPGPRIDIDKAEEIQRQGQIIKQKIFDELERQERIKTIIESLKSNGSLEKPKGVIALNKKRSVSQKIAAIAGSQNSEEQVPLEAPIIWFQPPPLSIQETLNVDKSSECILSQIGDEHSPAIKAERERALRDMAKFKGRTIVEIQQELTETTNAIKNVDAQRDELVEKLENMARKTSSTKKMADLAAEKLLASELQRKDEEYAALKKRKNNLLKWQAHLADEEAARVNSRAPRRIDNNPHTSI